MTYVLIVDDERSIHKSYRADILSAPERYTLVDTIVSAADALMVCGAKHIDLILMDINTAKNESGVEATRRIKKSFPTIKIIVTTSYTDPQALKEAKAAGADSFWFKDYSPVELMEVMDRTMDGRNYWPEETPDVELGNTTIHTLTDTEKEVLHYLVECISIKKMAEKMFVEETTVKTHLKNIYNKVGCSNKTELLVMVMCIFPDTQEAIVSQAQWDRVQELRKNKRRPTKAQRQGLFSGLLFCPDCGNKLHFATCKSFDGKQDHYVCSSYKSNRGTCTAHYIREDVLREIVLERIRAVNEYIRRDVDGFQEEWLQCRRQDHEKNVRNDKKRVEQAKKHLSDLEIINRKLYEDYALGHISLELYKKMSADYEAETERLKLEIEVTEEWVEQQQEMNDGLDAFIALTRKYVDVPELTPTIVNEYIKKIEVFAPDKSSGKRVQKVKIYFNFVDDVEIPVISEPVVAKSTPGRRKTA